VEQFVTFVNTTPIDEHRAVNRFCLIRNFAGWDGFDLWARQAMFKIQGEDKVRAGSNPWVSLPSRQLVLDAMDGARQPDQNIIAVGCIQALDHVRSSSFRASSQALCTLGKMVAGDG
jgi:hypothetical protein